MAQNLSNHAVQNLFKFFSRFRQKVFHYCPHDGDINAAQVLHKIAETASSKCITGIKGRLFLETRFLT